MLGTKSKRTTLTIISVIVGAFILLGLIAPFPVKTVSLSECSICRRELKETSWCVFAKRTVITTPAFAAWYDTIEPKHTHDWVYIGTTSHNVFGRFAGCALGSEHSLHLIFPDEEKDFLEHFPSNSIIKIAHHLRDDAFQEKFRNAIFATNQDEAVKMITAEVAKFPPAEASR